MVRGCLLTLSLLAVLGCAPLTELGRCLPDDGGSLDGGEDCLPESPTGDPATGFDDAGPLSPPEDPYEVACNTLVADVCGAGDPPPCADSAACTAAKLLQTYQPEDCMGALSNDVTYPECRPGPCSLLVDVVCGGPSADAACAEAPGCEPAKVLLARASSEDAAERAEAEASCNAALEDDIVFAPCR